MFETKVTESGISFQTEFNCECCLVYYESNKRCCKIEIPLRLRRGAPFFGSGVAFEKFVHDQCDS